MSASMQRRGPTRGSALVVIAAMALLAGIVPLAAPASAAVTVIDRPVVADADDAEEADNGSVDLTSGDLELVLDGSRGNQTVGMRFTNLAIPPGSAVTNAWVQFQADATGSTATSLVVRAQAADTAATFTTATGNVSSRPRTNTFVSWNPVSWTRRGRRPWPTDAEPGGGGPGSGQPAGVGGQQRHRGDHHRDRQTDGRVLPGRRRAGPAPGAGQRSTSQQRADRSGRVGSDGDLPVVGLSGRDRRRRRATGGEPGHGGLEPGERAGHRGLRRPDGGRHPGVVHRPGGLHAAPDRIRWRQERVRRRDRGCPGSGDVRERGPLVLHRPDLGGGGLAGWQR